MNRLRAIFCGLFGHRSIVLKIDGGWVSLPWRMKLLCERCGNIRSLKLKDPDTVIQEHKNLAAWKDYERSDSLQSKS